MLLYEKIYLYICSEVNLNINDIVNIQDFVLLNFTVETVNEEERIYYLMLEAAIENSYDQIIINENIIVDSDVVILGANCIRIF